MQFFYDLGQQAEHISVADKTIWLGGLVGDDRGFSDVALSFARGLGFNIRGMYEGEFPIGARAGINTELQILWMLNDLPPLERAHNVLHELAHYYTELRVGCLDFWAAEQVAELVAARISFDYGYDVTEPAAHYIRKHSYSAETEQVLGKYIYIMAEQVYELFSEELCAFITTV